MANPKNIVESTAHAQHLEMAALTGQPDTAALVKVNTEGAKALAQLQADYDALRESNAKLVEAHEAAGDEINALTEKLAAEQAAHAETQAALDAATPPAEENK